MVLRCDNDASGPVSEQGAGTGRNIRTAAASLAHRMYNTLKGKNNKTEDATPEEISLKELTEFLMKDPTLWSDFRDDLRDSHVVTNIGVNEVLKRFLARRREDLTIRYNEATAAAAAEAEAEASKSIPSDAASVHSHSGGESTVVRIIRNSSSSLSTMASSAAERIRRSSMDLQRNAPQQSYGAAFPKPKEIRCYSETFDIRYGPQSQENTRRRSFRDVWSRWSCDNIDECDNDDDDFDDKDVNKPADRCATISDFTGMTQPTSSLFRRRSAVAAVNNSEGGSLNATFPSRGSLNATFPTQKQGYSTVPQHRYNGSPFTRRADSYENNEQKNTTVGVPQTSNEAWPQNYSASSATKKTFGVSTRSHAGLMESKYHGNAAKMDLLTKAITSVDFDVAGETSIRMPFEDKEN